MPFTSGSLPGRRAAGVADDGAQLGALDDVDDGSGPGVSGAVGDGDEGSARVVGEGGDGGAFEGGAPAPADLAGFPAAEGGLGGSGPGGGIARGELAEEGVADGAADPGGDVDVALVAEALELSAYGGIDAEADCRAGLHADMIPRETQRLRKLQSSRRAASALASLPDVLHYVRHTGAGEGERLHLPLRTLTAWGDPRPPQSAMPRKSEQRSAVAHARVTPAELEQWQAKAAAAGIPLSELLRQAMRRTRAWTAAAAGVERARVREIARIGSNLNQIARWANTYKDAAEAVEVIAHLAAIEREMVALAHRTEDPDAH